MQVTEAKITKLIAEDGKIIRSKATHEEDGKIIHDVQAKIVYLGKNDSVENYEEIEEENLINE